MPTPSRQTTLPGMEVDPGSESLEIDTSAKSNDLTGWSICAIDAHSLIFQVFHAIPEMTSPHGEPVSAVFGFVRDILQLLETRKPDAIICAFDLPGPTYRHKLYSDYKADRGEMPADLIPQIPKITAVLDALGIPVVSSPGYEADDVLATLSRQCHEMGANCLIVTGDKDCRQLITERVSLFNIRKGQVYDAQSLQADWGILPNQVVDFQALVGDKVDNVPGVPLIGPKIAQELLSKYETLENVLDHASEVAGVKRQQNLINHRADALMSQQLARLETQVPVVFDWHAARHRKVNYEQLNELFRLYGFRTMGERVAALDRSGSAPPQTQPNPSTATYHLVDSEEKLTALVTELSQQPLISVDTETTDINPRLAQVVGYALAFEPEEGYYVPVRAPVGQPALDPQRVADLLRPILENPEIAKIGQNLKYDYVVLRQVGIRLTGIAFDTMIASFLLDSGERSHGLDGLALRLLGHETTKIDSLIGKGKNAKRMDQVSVEAVAPYAAEDAEIPLRLMPIMAEGLAEKQLEELNNTVEVPLVAILGDMEFEGISLDTKRLAELSAEYRTRLDKLTVEIEEMAGHPLNIASPKQLAELLFRELGLPVIKKTKTGASTDASVLEELASLHPLPAKIVEHRQYAKLLNTYIDALPAMVHPETGRVHASFNQVVATTGRLSSSNPNLQNIPIRTAEGREIRSAFQAGPAGWKLLAADYSQIELRVLAHFSEDETLCTAFANNEDIHTLVASQVENVSLGEVTSDMRRRAKAVNFGIIYGQSPFGLAKGLGISQDEAAQFIETYFARYPGVLQFMMQTLSKCREQGYVSTLLGRRRSVQGVRPVPAGLREEKTGSLRQLNLAERTAVNTVIQGSAADLIKLAMIGVERALCESSLSAKMLLQIHDELLFEVSPDEVNELARLVVSEMSGVLPLRVPLQVDVKFGDNWAECESWEEG
ncbi:DNA polymerase I [Bythopirellula polymerisocia]|uniref:DNA polymerase I n=1 Tax=Bythopirellula polymerisocia TaxID=2528003 RepID=A0A5C6CUK4_9BACT|nr:DNA polymerase I [Bythopirellula polymerisocia]TWU27334.1 DNA polymerase I [Bythopirellula polymerisocia]